MHTHTHTHTHIHTHTHTHLLTYAHTHTHRTEPGVDGITNANFFKNLFIMGDGGGEGTGKVFF